MEDEEGVGRRLEGVRDGEKEVDWVPPLKSPGVFVNRGDCEGISPVVEGTALLENEFQGD